MDNHCQESLFKAMSYPDFYPHPVRYVMQKDTHISKVFLTGEYVYKIKKPVNLGFLDFSSLAKRHHYCQLEVTLNRRLSDQVYLDVVPITESDKRFCLSGAGNEVEFAVRMHQLPDTCSLSSMLKQNRITIEQIETLASTLTDFYVRQGGVSQELAVSSWKNIRASCEENFRQTQWAIGDLLNSDLYRAVRSATYLFLTHCKTLFNHRSESGKIYHGHGDLRSGHIYYTGGNGIQIIDCIEFSSRFRNIDVASDLAFLIMDLDFRGAPLLGSTLLDAYVRKTRDWQIYALIPFYKCYRAMVRCKVNCIRLKKNHRGNNNSIALQRKANRYLAYAHRYAEHFARPTIWVLCGLPGSGKSTLARILSDKLALNTLRSDVIRKQLFEQIQEEQTAGCLEQDIYSPAAHRLTYGKLLRLARNALDQKKSIIIDATFSHPEYRHQVLQLTNDTRSRAIFIECIVPDNLLKARLKQREDKPSVSDARQHHFEILKKRYVPMEEIDQTLRLQVDTSQPIHDCVHAIMSWDYMASLMPVENGKRCPT